MTNIHLHLVSDSTGETILHVTRASMSQFKNVAITEHVWSLIRTVPQVEKLLKQLEKKPGPVLFTMVNPKTRDLLEDGCRLLNLPAISVLDPVIVALSSFLGEETIGKPGLQYSTDDAYFRRMDAINYTLSHDDGQASDDLDRADIILLGVSRTSKTPTAMYLANRAYKVANIPLVPNFPLPKTLFSLKDSLIVGLITNPDRLVQIRRNRLPHLNGEGDSDYTDLDTVRREVTEARRLFQRQGWPVVDVSRRSIEETSAAILLLYQDFIEERG